VHREQQALALDVIISLLAERKGLGEEYARVESVRDNWRESYFSMSRGITEDRKEADKKRAELRAILEAAHYDVTGVRYLTAGEYGRAMELVK